MVQIVSYFGVNITHVITDYSRIKVSSKKINWH